jgi:PTS system mannose-specific IID component
MVARLGIPGFSAALARLFMIQAAWSYERMLGIGFGFAAEPMLRGLKQTGDGRAFREALARESGFFNAHPYLASLAVGAAARAETDGVPPEKIERLRSALVGPLGSLGDRLIWAGWLPACAAIGLLLVACSAGAWAVIVFLALYNLMHVWLRVWGLRAGWRSGVGVAGALAAPGLQRALEAVAPVAAVAVGAALPSVLLWFPFRAGWEAGAGAAAALGFAAVVRLLQPRATGLVTAAAVLAAVLAVGMLWP